MSDTNVPAAGEARLWLPGWLRRPLFRKGCVLVFLTLLFLLPIELLRGLVVERQWRQEQVAGEIGRLWGPPQTLTGPLVAVPVVEARGSRGLALILPEALAIEGELAPEVRRRGLFEALVYGSTLAIETRFRLPAAEAFGLQASQLLWDEARLLLTADDLAGLEGAVPVELEGGGESYFRPARLLPQPGALEAPLTAARPAQTLAASFTLTLDGSRRLAIVPSGEATRLSLSSSWPHPSFGGAGLPGTSAISTEGFTAEWAVSAFAGGLPPTLLVTADELANGDPLWRLRQAALGVELIQPVDAYVMSERAVKYALFVIALVFAAVFLFEAATYRTSGGRPLHPVQYLLVGAAETIFYLLLLSLSEAVGFAVAYLAASAATVGLIALYLARALGSAKRALALAGGLTAVKGYLWVTLASEDFALLSGSLALFLLLAAVMLATRKVDWYGVGTPSPSGRGSG